MASSIGSAPKSTACAWASVSAVPWLVYSCGHCAYCRPDCENLCDTPLFTGHGRDGGFVTHVVAEAA